MLYSRTLKFIFYKDSSSRLWIFSETKVVSAFIAKPPITNPIILKVNLNLRKGQTFFLKIVLLMSKINKKCQVFPMTIKTFYSKISLKSTTVSLVIELTMASSNAGILLKKKVLKILKKLKISTLKFILAHTINAKKSSIFSQDSLDTK